MNKQRYIFLGEYIVSVQHGDDSSHILTIDVHDQEGQFLDGFALYTTTPDIRSTLLRKFPLATAEDIQPLLESTLHLANNPNDWPTFFQSMLLSYNTPTVEHLVELRLLPESALDQQDEEN